MIAGLLSPSPLLVFVVVARVGSPSSSSAPLRSRRLREADALRAVAVHGPALVVSVAPSLPPGAVVCLLHVLASLAPVILGFGLSSQSFCKVCWSNKPAISESKVVHTILALSSD